MKGLIIVTLIIFSSSLAFAIDLGKRGMTFSIKEEGFVDMMTRKLKDVDLEKENEKMRKIAEDRVKNPMPVISVKPATEKREYLWDPTYRLTEDAVLPCGKVLHRAGTKVNPLDYMDLDRRLIFIDARENNQVEWLKDNLNREKAELQNDKKDRTPEVESRTEKDNLNKGNTKPLNGRESKTPEVKDRTPKIENRIILVGGSVFDLQDELKEEYSEGIYFDQSGELTTKFGIKASPAVAVQEGKMLRVREIYLK